MVRYGFGRAGGGKRHRADGPWAENTPCRQRVRGVMCVLGAKARSRSPRDALTRLPHAAGIHRIHRLPLFAAEGLAKGIKVLD